MASSNMRALWEARADHALANMDQKSNISPNERKHSNVEPSDEPHRPRLGSNRRTISANRKLNGMRKQSKESVDSLDDILFSLQNAIIADKEDDPDTNVVNDAKKGVNMLKEKIMEKNYPQISKAEEYPRQNGSGSEKTSPIISNIDQVFRQNSKVSEGQSPKVSNNDLVHRQFSKDKKSTQSQSNGQVLRQNSKDATQKSHEITKTETLVGQEETPKTTKGVKQTLDSKGTESSEANFTNDREKATNDGENILGPALNSLQSTEPFERNEQVNENVEMENVKENSHTDILMRIVDENTTDICQVKRQSARLSLHNTLEIVPENEPIETKHTEPKENNEDEITDIIEKLEKCNDLESLKCACINTFIALNKTLVEMKASLAENSGNTKPILNSPPSILAPPPPPPPGPPPLSLGPKKLVITKAPKPTMASTATAAVGAVNLMDEIKRKQMIRKGRKSLKSRYETLDNK